MTPATMPSVANAAGRLNEKYGGEVVSESGRYHDHELAIQGNEHFHRLGWKCVSFLSVVLALALLAKDIVVDRARREMVNEEAKPESGRYHDHELAIQGNEHFHRLGWKRLTIVLIVQTCGYLSFANPTM
jgi:hypothetical protein